MGTAPAEFTSVIAIAQSGFDPRSSRFERWARSISAAILSPASIEPAMTIARRSLGSSSFQRFLATARSLAASEVRRTETYRTLILPQQPAATVSVSRPAQSAMMRLNLGPRPRRTRFWIVAQAAMSQGLLLWLTTGPEQKLEAVAPAAPRWPQVREMAAEERRSIGASRPQEQHAGRGYCLGTSATGAPRARCAEARKCQKRDRIAESDDSDSAAT
jgi:hypothetical protein